MNAPDQKHDSERSIGRRKEDFLVREQVRRYNLLFRVGQIITSEINMDVLFEVIIDQTNQIIGTERSTVFLYDEKEKQLWSLVATGMQKNEIRIPSDHGVAGWVFQNQEPVLINDAYKDPRFYSEIDRQSAFTTRNIICVPLINRDNQCIGVLEGLNKLSGDFKPQDSELLISISHYVTIALENSKLYEELKLLDKAKERIINHLSHELKTPLALISGVLGKVNNELKNSHVDILEKTVKRGQRNLDRLLDLQMKIDDILEQRSVEEKDRIIHIIEDAASFIDELSENEQRQAKGILELIYERIESLFSVEEIYIENISLAEFLHDTCNEAVAALGDRRLNIHRNFEQGIDIQMDRTVLKKVCAGLLKNAIENTPDEGTIEVICKSENDLIRIDYQDYGVGITPQNQKMIFGGFFHTQDTALYSSKRPYEFNAGGSGSDLLRMKCFSDRFGFSIDFETTRCEFIASDTDQCPGKISQCQFVSNKSGCFSSGGSIFTLRFPNSRFR